MGMNREERIAAMGAVVNPKMLTTAEFVAYMTRALEWFATSGSSKRWPAGNG
jgi:hypothetical protein